MDIFNETTSKLSTIEVLRYLEANGKINLSDVQEQIDMQKRRDILERHPYSIWEGKDGYWRTYLLNGNQERKLVKKKNKKDIENLIIEFVKNNIVNVNDFKTRFDVWVERQQIIGRSGNTLIRYREDYEKYFAGYPIEDMMITDITDADICKHLKLIINDKKPTYSALKAQFGYIKGVFEKAVIDKIVPRDSNPCCYVDIRVMKNLCRSIPPKKVSERTISANESSLLLHKMKNPNYRNKRPNIIAYKAIELAMLTGMRVGELAGLLWEDINFEEGYIVIAHSERYDRLTKTYSLGDTKNGAIRTVPLTDDIIRVLNETRDLEDKNGWLGESVFMNANGIVHCRIISACIRNLTLVGNFEKTKSIHTIRRTVNSKMRCSGVSAKVASALIGHTERVNENHYTYNIEEYERQRQIIDNAKLI